MPDILTRLKFFMIAPRIKRRRGAPSTLVARGFTVEPLVPLSDDEIVDRAELPSWSLTEALFWLGGYRSPGYESDRHMQDHFWSAYNQARLAIRQGDLCRKTVEAGETVFYDRPGNWLAWADRIGLKYIKVDERMRRALSQMADSPDGTVKEEPQPVVSKSIAEGAGLQLALPSQARETKEKRERTHDVEADALLQNRIKGVLAKAKARWPKPKKRPGLNQMAGLLVNGQPKNKVEGFGRDAIRKILAGTYKSAKKRSIPGLSSW